jgi:hypothetical protein
MTVLAEPESKKEPELKQKRFFCENCEREVFLNASYCDKCGGKIEWPEKYKSIFSKDKQSKRSSDEEKEKED